jgi:hypothetical protein
MPSALLSPARLTSRSVWRARSLAGGPEGGGSEAKSLVGDVSSYQFTANALRALDALSGVSKAEVRRAVAVARDTTPYRAMDPGRVQYEANGLTVTVAWPNVITDVQRAGKDAAASRPIRESDKSK